MNVQRIVKSGSMWLLRFSFYTGIILAMGTLIGSLGFIVIGSLFIKGYTCEFLLKKGAWIGFRYAGVWAGGAAVVLCCMKAKKMGDKRSQLADG